MARKLAELTIFASGSTETESERSALRRVAEELNKQLEKVQKLTLRVRAWPDDVRPGVNTYTQEELNHQLGTDYDIYLGALGCRFGTPTRRAGSGTEEEFNQALATLLADSQRLRVLFYFKRSAEDVFTIDIDQLALVKRFQKRLRGLGVVYREFSDTSEFVQLTKDHLYNLIVDEWKGECWSAIPGLADAAAIAASPSSENSRAQSADSLPPGSPPMTSLADAVLESSESVEDADLGLLDHLEKFHDAVPAVVETFEAMSRVTGTMNERIEARTEELNTLQQQHENVKHVGGSRAQQQYVSRAKEIIDGTAEDVDEYARNIDAALSDYRTHSRLMLDNFKASLRSGGELWTDQTKQENRGVVSVKWWKSLSASSSGL